MVDRLQAGDTILNPVTLIPDTTIKVLWVLVYSGKWCDTSPLFNESNPDYKRVF